jgi:hypothetical protein
MRGNPSHRKLFIYTTAFDGDDNPLEGLNPFPSALNDTHFYINGITRLQVWSVF